ncbi:hypothetical protein [Halomontanus rarus]|uniref:hypothetical protein n=1 Tax=Halomontanus rarus TaxID=3034020 RepID=UPI0023E79F66|nr:hypothetical protein [Halovivax sp. TS33]
MSGSRREVFWKFVCESKILGFDIIVIDIVILLLLSYSFLHIEPGSASFVVAVITAAFALLTLVIMSGLFVVCGRIDWTN